MSRNKRRNYTTKNTNNRTYNPESIKEAEQILGKTIPQFVSDMKDVAKRKEFANNLAKSIAQIKSMSDLASTSGEYQPLYSQQVLQQINTTPSAASSHDIDLWLSNPTKYDKNLRSVSQYLSYAVGQYHRTLWYFNTLKEYNYELIPSDSNVDEAINEDDYWHSYDIALRVCQKLNLKYQLQKVDFSTLTDGVSFWWIDETDDYITLLQLPTNWCYITSSWTMGFRFAIDLTFFDQMAPVPKQIPELYTAYIEFNQMRERLAKGDKTATPIQYYSVPVDKGWVFTWDSVHPDKVPALASSMASALDTLSYRDLLKNKLALDLYKVIAFKIPMDDRNNQMAIPLELAVEITQMVQKLLPGNIKVFSTPFESNAVQTDETSRFNELIDVGNNNFFASAGVQKGAFGSGDVNTGTSLQTSCNIDYIYVKHMYRQYENFVNWQIAKHTKKYTWQIHMFGNNLNRTQEIKDALSIVSGANTGIMHLFAAIGYEPYQIKGQLQLEDKLGLRDLLIPVANKFNQGNAGRPESDTVGDAGAITRDYDSNNDK